MLLFFVFRWTFLYGDLLLKRLIRIHCFHILFSFMILSFFLSCQHLPILPSNWKQQFQDRHTAVYDVYRLGPDPDSIHHHLAESFYGEALTQEYIEHYATLVHMLQEETSIDVKRVDYTAIEQIYFSIDKFVIDVDWSVGGVVTHQKHKHPRVNRYKAVYTLLPDSEGNPHAWKIMDTKMRNLERVQRAALSEQEFLSMDDLFSADDSYEDEDGGGFLDPLDLIDAGIKGSPASKEQDTD